MRLNQAVAIEKGVKSKTTSVLSELYKQAQKPALFDGFTKTYSPSGEEDEDLPPESQRVQATTGAFLRLFSTHLTELLDITATKDYGNTQAKADVVLPDGTVLISAAPVPYLLFLEKQLVDARTFLGSLPTLDPAEEWSADPTTGWSRSRPTKRTRSVKDQRAIMLAPATDKHPAQVQLIPYDRQTGSWEHIKFSGAMEAPRKAALVERVDVLLKSVKAAREEANTQVITPQQIGEKVFGWLLAG